YVGVAAFTVLVWDHVITFSDEVEYIWKGRKGLATYLFFLNRYLIPLSFIINLWAYNRKSWSLHVSHLQPVLCSHFVRYEGSMAMIAVTVVALIMFLRVRALYAQCLSVQVFILSILFTFIGVNSWLLTRGVRKYTLSSDMVTFTDLIQLPGPLASSTAWLPLLYDTVVIFLTIKGTARYIQSKDTGLMFRALLQEGLLYYSVICSVTLVFTIMILFAEPSVRNITGHLTVAMMSRITIHLKRFAH
ncbi:hypothetical protein BJV74DRAFT_749465, partial [Russula compacta]